MGRRADRTHHHPCRPVRDHGCWARSAGGRVVSRLVFSGHSCASDMGRDAGHIALNTGIGAGAEEILIPEENMGIERLLQSLKNSEKSGKSCVLLVKNREKSEKSGKIRKIRKNRVYCGYCP